MGLAWGALLTLLGCASEPEVLVLIDAPATLQDVASLTVLLAGGGEPRVEELGPVECWPVLARVTPAGGSEEFRVEAVAALADGSRVVVGADVAFGDDRRQVRLTLDPTCGAAEACGREPCVAACAEDAGCCAARATLETWDPLALASCVVPVAHCENGVRDQGESDTDCGGTCGGCTTGDECAAATDCLSGICGERGECLSEDCDGSCGAGCDPCEAGEECSTNLDCRAGACFAGVCLAEHCGDAAVNGDETDLNCGGSCAPCGAGQSCAGPADCVSHTCTGEAECGDGCFAAYGLACDAVEITELLPATQRAGLNFGSSVAISGDRVAVGAPLHDAGDEVASGAVYVYRRIDGAWGLEHVVVPANAEDSHGAKFGASVDLQGDLLLVGAPDSAERRGAAFVFRFYDEDWHEEAALTPTDLVPWDRFGESVSLDGDRVAIGASHSHIDVPTEVPGAAYLFELVDGVWTQSARLCPGGEGDAFGRAVDLEGARLAVGAPRDSANRADGSSASERSGAVYVYELESEEWMLVTLLKAEVLDGQDHFGVSVSLRGDEIAVGAFLEDSGAPNDPTDATATSSGAAYVFARSEDEAWSQVRYLKHSAPEATERFGIAVVRESEELLWVGLPEEGSSVTGILPDASAPSGDTDQGGVVLFRRFADLGWTQLLFLKLEAPERGDQIGTYLDAEDGVLVVATPNRAQGGLENVGAVWVYEFLPAD